MTEPTEVTFKPEAPADPPKPDKAPGQAAPGKAAPPAAAAAPARALPSPEEIGEWIHGADLPTLGALFEGLPVVKFDALVMQVRKEELIPQHWQPITHRPPL